MFANTHYYMPQSFGGMSVTLHQLSVGLASRGHQVGVLAGFRHGGAFARRTSVAMKLNRLAGRGKVAGDQRLGYRVWRSWDVAGDLERISARFHPDVIVIMGGQVVPVALAARRTGLPLLLQVHDVELHFHGGDFMSVSDLPCVANSHFTARFYRERFGVRCNVIYPFVKAEAYRVESAREEVTFVNPYIHKGLKVALAVAEACPDIPFSFVGELPDSDAEDRALARRVAAAANIAMVPPQSDMRAVYRRSRILIAPSQWEEAYGRVANEAMISGIPVVGSSRGGLPEAIGEGGTILTADAPVHDWVAAVRRLWEDDDFHAEMSARARSAAARPELDLTVQLDAHEQALADAVAAARVSAAASLWRGAKV
ncbi:glycosyltransferase [Sphingomonas koreensis]|nr:glycosyltransferase [Sphingomonas koreensis]